MGKRKPTTGVSDLRTNPIPLQLHRYINLKTLQAGALEHWNVQSIQPYFPAIERLFKTEKLENTSEYGIRFSDEIVNILSPTQIKTISGSLQDVHLKTSMILSPFKTMRGEYGDQIGLPTTEEKFNNMRSKVISPHNSSYIGALISIALSQSGCEHFPKVYGVFSGMAKHHTIDISDDYGELSERSWFSQNIGKTFDIKLSENVKNFTEFRHTRNAKLTLQIGEDTSLEDIQTIEAINSDITQAGDISNVFEHAKTDDDDESDSSSVSTSYFFNVHSCDCHSDDEDDEELDISEEDGETSDPFAWASFTNAPVQITVMEKCEGTLYRLFMEFPDSEKHLAWLSQVMFALAYAQRTIGLTHNDLHANNVMYVKTSKEYLYYNLAGVCYRVPTYGYLIKIIDFERGIASIKLAGMKDAKIFMSDHFSFEEEAGGQYNVEPFYNAKFERIKPNASFDLVRLATSIFWDLFPEGPLHDEYKANPVFTLFMKWLTLDDETSILFGKTDPHHDRFHGFHLYKAIVRYCKDNAIPAKEISFLKSFYAIDRTPPSEDVCTILM